MAKPPQEIFIPFLWYQTSTFPHAIGKVGLCVCPLQREFLNTLRDCLRNLYLLKYPQRLPTTKVIGDGLPRGQVAGQVAPTDAVDEHIEHRTIQVVEAVSSGCADAFAFVEGAFEGGFDDRPLLGRWV